MRSAFRHGLIWGLKIWIPYAWSNLSKQPRTIHILRKLRVNKLNIDSGFLQVLNNEELLSIFYSLCFQVFLMWIVFIMKNTQYIFKKENIKLSNSAISKKLTFFTLNDAQFPISKWNTCGHNCTYKFKWRRKAITGISPGKKHFCLDYLYLSDRIVFCPGIIQMTASFTFPLTLHVQPQDNSLPLKNCGENITLRRRTHRKIGLWEFSVLSFITFP